MLCRDEGSGLSSEGEIDATRLVGSRGGFAHGGPGPGWVARIGRRGPRGARCRVRVGEEGDVCPTHSPQSVCGGPRVGRCHVRMGGGGGECPNQSPQSGYSEPRGVRCCARMGEGGACAPPTHLRADAVNFVGKMSRTYGGRGGVCPTQSPHSRYSELRGVRCRVRMGEGGASAPPTHLRADTAMPLLHAGLMTGSSGA